MTFHVRLFASLSSLVSLDPMHGHDFFSFPRGGPMTFHVCMSAWLSGPVTVRSLLTQCMAMTFFCSQREPMTFHVHLSAWLSSLVPGLSLLTECMSMTFFVPGGGPMTSVSPLRYPVRSLLTECMAITFFVPRGHI